MKNQIFIQGVPGWKVNILICDSVDQLLFTEIQTFEGYPHKAHRKSQTQNQNVSTKAND